MTTTQLAISVFTWSTDQRVHNRLIPLVDAAEAVLGSVHKPGFRIKAEARKALRNIVKSAVESMATAQVDALEVYSLHGCRPVMVGLYRDPVLWRIGMCRVVGVSTSARMESFEAQHPGLVRTHASVAWAFALEGGIDG